MYCLFFHHGRKLVKGNEARPICSQLEGIYYKRGCSWYSGMFLWCNLQGMPLRPPTAIKPMPFPHFKKWRIYIFVVILPAVTSDSQGFEYEQKCVLHLSSDSGNCQTSIFSVVVAVAQQIISPAFSRCKNPMLRAPHYSSLMHVELLMLRSSLKPFILLLP